MEFNLSQPVRIEEELWGVDQWHEGRLILIDKPLDWTSFDLVNKCKFSIRHGLQIKTIKIGHAGTLDPKATGLMILLTGKYTKLTDHIHTFDKSYEAVLFLGGTTPCFDTERPIDAYFPTEHITEALIRETSNQFMGHITQVPPIFSAVKIDGKAAYKSAHKGIEVVTKVRQVDIFKLDILKVNLPYVHIAVRCSTGTYIRSLAHDLGKALHSGAYLHSLRRTEIGPWHIDQALDINVFTDKLKSYQTLVDDPASSI